MATLDTGSDQGRASIRKVRTLLTRARRTRDAYLTVAVLDRDRRERALARFDLVKGVQPGRALDRAISAHRPAPGDVGYRVRLWLAGGVPRGGVTVRLAPGQAPVRPRTRPQGKRTVEATSAPNVERAKRRDLEDRLAAERRRRQEAEAEVARLRAEVAEWEDVAEHATARLQELSS